MKIQKGSAGYITAKKRQLGTIIGVVAILAIALIAAGYIKYHTRLNWCTIAAILICIPVCRTIVNLIMFIPYDSVSERTEMEISGKSEDLTVLYDLIITSEKQAMKIDALFISKNTVCGYSSFSKLDTDYTAKFIKSILEQNHIEKVTVKIFKDYVAFLSRVEGMQSIVSIEKNMDKEQEESIAQLILDISL